MLRLNVGVCVCFFFSSVVLLVPLGYATFYLAALLHCSQIHLHPPTFRCHLPVIIHLCVEVMQTIHLNPSNHSSQRHSKLV